MKQDIDIKKEYQILSKKHKLPDFDVLDKEFEISNIQDINEKFLIRAIRRRVNEKIAFFIRILDGILHPASSSVISTHENRFFTDEEKQEALKVMRKLMQLDRKGLKIDIDPDINLDVDFINDVFKNFNDIKIKVKKIASKMEEAWSKEEEEKFSDIYFG